MITHFRIGNDQIGRSIAEELIRDFPDTDHERNALLALFYSDMSRKDVEEAQNTLDLLTSHYSSDPDVQAARLLAQLEGVERDARGKTGRISDEVEPGDVDVDTYPNPFNPEATIAYTLATESHVRLAIHDILGRKVASLVDRSQPAGRQQNGFRRIQFVDRSVPVQT